MNNVVKGNFKKKAALAIKCTACGAEGIAGCECGATYMPAITAAEKAVAANPEKSLREIADETGVSRETVRRARKASGDTNVSPGKARVVGKDKKSYPAERQTAKSAAPATEPRKLPKPPKIDPDVIKQAGAFHNELTKYTGEFCARIKSWHAANKIDEESHGCVVEALETASMRLQMMAQEIDDR